MFYFTRNYGQTLDH